jgi:UDP-N-acetylglucosamine--N-acetylmuramyl-(pentapeptide) pyrophosphoryl-undecaprenol N-acetylglucosamine transferase
METVKKSSSLHRVCFVAGKSGGHILPCITLAQNMLGVNPDCDILFFSTASSLDKQIIAKNSFVKKYIALDFEASNLKNILTWPRFLYTLAKSFIKSIRELKKHKPEVVISTGGFIAIPVCLTARILRIPVELYELNVVPGQAIKFLAPCAQKIWICFKETATYLPHKKCTLTQYPVKFNEQKLISKDKVLDSLKFSPNRKTILVLGGSQGSLFINRSMIELFEQQPTLAHVVQVVHQTGSLDRTDWKKIYDQKGVPCIVFDYAQDLEAYYQIADLIICRAGAGTLAEISFFNKKCITIPLETKTNSHQVDNALAAARLRPDLFTVINQEAITHDYRILCEGVARFLQ